jgi:hypothetical protein
MPSDGRSQWLQVVRHEPSSPARTLGSWVPKSLETWIFVWVYSVFVLSCVYAEALRRAHPPSEESNWKNDQGPKGWWAIERSSDAWQSLHWHWFLLFQLQRSRPTMNPLQSNIVAAKHVSPSATFYCAIINRIFHEELWSAVGWRNITW